MVNAGKQKKDLPYFTQDDHPKFVPMWMAEEIQKDYDFATHKESEEIYVYENGIYKPYGKTKIKEETQKRLGRYSKNHYINETVERIRIDNYIPEEKFNNPDNKIVVENGVLDLETKELEDHTPEYIHITKIPWEYNPDADCPKIEKFISEIVEDEDVKIIQEMFGYCLLKDYPIAEGFMLLGQGANGKSTLLNLLEKFLGEENVASPALQEILNNRFAKIDLFGKLANIHADLSNKELRNTGTFKMLTGGDTIRAEKKHQDPIKFKNYAKLVYSANQLPETTDNTEAFYRRWIIIQFPYKFVEKEEIKEDSNKYKEKNANILDEILTEEEMSGLLNWALEGLERLQENGKFSISENLEEIKQIWKERTAPTPAFINKYLEKQNGYYLIKDDIYEFYKDFCKYHGKSDKIKSRSEFFDKVKIKLNAKDYRPNIQGKQVRCLRGIKFCNGEEYLEEKNRSFNSSKLNEYTNEDENVFDKMD